MRKGIASQVLVVVVTAAAFSCTSRADAPSASPEGEPAPSAGTGTPAGAAAVVTRATIGQVAGRLDDTRRQRVKTEVQAVVDAYLDAAWVAGPWPRDDFSAAFASFRPGAAATAATDVDLLTNHDVGAGLTAVTATRRRVKIDVLAPGDRAKAATATFRLDLELTGTAPAPTGPLQVTGALYLSHHDGAWTVFGYDVDKGQA